MSSDLLYNHLIEIKETYKTPYGLVCYRSKYLERARYVLYRQRIFDPPPKLIINRKDLPRWALIDKYKDLLIRDATKKMFMNINEEIYNDVKISIRVGVE